MGAVYLASDARHPDFFVAIKVLYPGVIKSRDARERFRNEIVASYRVNHPNIVRAYEYFDQDDFQAFAMEFVDGGDLFQKMKSGAMPPSEALKILKQIASGLSAVHAEGIIHRDLKPENILLTQNGVVKITDFGVARLRGNNTITQIGAMVGTPRYLAPEYVETGEADFQSDIYALGVMGYEMISGGSPFRSNSKVSLMVERLKYHVEPLHRVARHCPKNLARVIEKAMAVSIHRRYKTASDLLIDLELVGQDKEPLIDDDEESSFRSFIQSVFRPEPSIVSQSGAAKQRSKGLFKFCKYLVVLSLLLGASTELYQNWSKLGFRTLSFSQLPKGIYRGLVNGALSDNEAFAIELWHTESGDFVKIDNGVCAVAKLSEDYSFACGPEKFRLKISAIERGSAIGTIVALGSEKTATWNLVDAGLEEVNKP